MHYRSPWLCSLLVLALLVSAMLPFFVAYNDASRDSLAELFGDKVLICTSEGYQWIDVSDLDGEGEHEGQAKCPLCVFATLKLDNLKAPGNVSLSAPLTITPTNFISRSSGSYALASATHYTSRAPPFLSA